jgi:hypothetical protein
MDGDLVRPLNTWDLCPDGGMYVNIRMFPMICSRTLIKHASTSLEPPRSDSYYSPLRRIIEINLLSALADHVGVRLYSEVRPCKMPRKCDRLAIKSLQ